MLRGRGAFSASSFGVHLISVDVTIVGNRNTRNNTRIFHPAGFLDVVVVVDMMMMM
jgi:hypothetical protein